MHKKMPEEGDLNQVGSDVTSGEASGGSRGSPHLERMAVQEEPDVVTILGWLAMYTTLQGLNKCSNLLRKGLSGHLWHKGLRTCGTKLASIFCLDTVLSTVTLMEAGLSRTVWQCPSQAVKGRGGLQGRGRWERGGLLAGGGGALLSFLQDQSQASLGSSDSCKDSKAPRTARS